MYLALYIFSIWQNFHFNKMVFVTVALSSGDVTVRLADDSTKYEGRVEYSWYGIWGTICDSQWTFKAAAVVFRQLGFGGVETIYLRAHFGEGYGQTLGYIISIAMATSLKFMTAIEDRTAITAVLIMRTQD